MAKITFVIQTSWVIDCAKVRVTVHDTLEELQKLPNGEKAGGLCYRWHIENKPLKGQTFAHIHLVKDKLGIGLVTHEVVHAATQIYRLEHKMTELLDDDEPFAYCVGDLVSKLYNQLYKRNLIE